MTLLVFKRVGKLPFANERLNKSASCSEISFLNGFNTLVGILYEPVACHNPKGIKLLSRIRLGLSHLRKHKFKHSFQDTLNPICICGKDIETPCHYLLACPNYDVERSTLLNNLRQIAPNILNYNNSRITQVLLYCDTSFKNETKTNILKNTISYLLATKRFDKPIFED